jgi:hypothetical protein
MPHPLAPFLEDVLRIPRIIAATIGTLALAAALPFAATATASADTDDTCGTTAAPIECVHHHGGGGDGLFGLFGGHNYTTVNNYGVDGYAWNAALERNRAAHLREEQLRFAYSNALAAQNACGCNPTRTYVIQQQYVAAQDACATSDRQFFALRRY